MKLNVLSRVLLLSLLPKEGNITTLRIVRKLQEDLSFTEEEYKQFALTSVDGTVTWKNDVETDIAIGPRAHVVIQETLMAHSREKTLRSEHLSLCDLFLEEDKPVRKPKPVREMTGK